MTHNPGSSGFGPSYYSRRSLCEALAYYDKEVEKERAESGLPMEDGAAHDGVQFHKLAEIFYGTALNLPKQELGEISEKVAQSWIQYIAALPEVDFWGTPFAVELALPPDDLEAQARVRTAFGVVDKPVQITGRLDMVTQVSAEQAQRMQERLGLELPGPGLYIVDHKTSGQRDEGIVIKFDYESQTWWYPHLYTAVYEVPVMGMIYNRVIFHKEMSLTSLGNRGSSFQPTFIPTRAPTLEQLEAIQPARTPPKKNPFFCTKIPAGGRTVVCSHLLSGRCTGGR